MSSTPAYDNIGKTYTRSRQAEPRIVDRLVQLLGLPKGSIVADIGAGTGNYTSVLADRGFRMVAIEPSATMRAQARPHPQVVWQEGVAEQLPLAANGVSGVVSTLAIHHFTDRELALREMDRVAGRGPIVLFTFDITATETSALWLRDYWPMLDKDASFTFPPLAELAVMAEQATGRTAEIIPFPLPPDLADLFLAAGWRRPELYLDANVRAGISSFAISDPEAIATGVTRLENDLKTGVWAEKYATFLTQETFDAGYRFLVLRR